MSRFRLRQLETVLGRGPRSGLCPDCGGLGLREVMAALDVVDKRTPGDRAVAQQILEEFENQPPTCSACGALTFAADVAELGD